jgi:CBS domain-containing protein
VAFSIITVAHVVLGELAPKSAAISRTGPIALLLAPPMRGFYLATKPVVDLFNAMGNLVLKPFGIPPASEAGHAPHSEDELRQLLRESHEGGLIQADESELSEAALVFGDLRAGEVMQPRHEIDYVTTTDTIDQVIGTAMPTGRTRLPLVEHDGDLDHALGVINAKDLLPAALGQSIELHARARPLPRVAEGTRVDEVLRDMRRQQRHLGLVVDEHGTVTGLLTLEDVLEELVGEIDDEFDPAAEQLIQRRDGELRVDGSAPVRLVAGELGHTRRAARNHAQRSPHRTPRPRPPPRRNRRTRRRPPRSRRRRRHSDHAAISAWHAARGNARALTTELTARRSRAQPRDRRTRSCSASTLRGHASVSFTSSSFRLGRTALPTVCTLEAHRYQLDHHLLPAFGRRRVAAFTVDDVAELLHQLRRTGRSAKTAATRSRRCRA